MPVEVVVVGPPGTGKTEASIAACREWFKDGAQPGEVAYLAFTKAAAREAASRILDEDQPPKENPFPYFRTIHSLAYAGLKSIRPGIRVLTPSDMKRFSKSTGYEGVYAVSPSEDLSEAYQQMDGGGRTHWDKAHSAYTLSRISATTVLELEEAKRKISRTASRVLGPLEDAVYQAFVLRYEAFKEKEGLADFTDMLAYGLLGMPPLDRVKYALVDEAQDLAPLLHQVVYRLFRNAEQLWWVGDWDQAIYTFAAADPKLFSDKLTRASWQLRLRQTHRFGNQIVQLSDRVIERVKDRPPKEVVGLAGRDHEVKISGSFKPAPGYGLILHRHVQGCQIVAQRYIESGLPFRNERGKDPLGAAVRVKSYKTIMELAAGKKCAVGAVSRLVEELIPSVLANENGTKTRLVVHGGKMKLQEMASSEGLSVPDLIAANILTGDGAAAISNRSLQLFKHADDLDYYDRVTKNGYELEGKCPTITTIHGSKGRQASSVLLFSEMGRRCWDDRDGEHRLAYVAVTRTRGDLEICAEQTVDWAESKYDYPVEVWNGKR